LSDGLHIEAPTTRQNTSAIGAEIRHNQHCCFPVAGLFFHPQQLRHSRRGSSPGHSSEVYSKGNYLSLSSARMLPSYASSGAKEKAMNRHPYSNGNSHSPSRAFSIQPHKYASSPSIVFRSECPWMHVDSALTRPPDSSLGHSQRRDGDDSF